MVNANTGKTADGMMKCSCKG